MSMLKLFFEDDRDRHGNKKDWSYLFNGLKIMDAGESYTSHMGQYPVIYLTFKDSKWQTLEESYHQIVDELAHEFERHSFVLECPDLYAKKDKYIEIMSRRATRTEYGNSIKFLSECLEIYYGKRPIVMIDEYDVPLENAFTCGFYDQMITFIRILFESALKDNTSLEFAVITGCLRVSKESIFTGLNNLRIVSIRNEMFGEYFGFKVSEVQQIIDKKYDKELRNDSYKIISFYDMAFFGKECVVHCLPQNMEKIPRF